MSTITRNEVLRDILSIGREASIRGAGLSLRNAIEKSRYVEFRHLITPDELIVEVRKESSFIDDWIRFCEDKRTSGGWVLVPESHEIWLFKDPDKRFKFDSIEETVANYVLAELDYWIAVDAA